jgi:hypothetical protein
MDDKTVVGAIPVDGDGAKSGSMLTSMTEYEGTAGNYEIFSLGGSALVATDEWKLYVAKLPTGQLGLMKIAATPEHNSVLEREARILQTLQKIATDMDNEATERGEVPYFYGALLPLMLESFVSDDGRVVMFLGYHSTISTYKQLNPLVRVLDGQRIDLKTGTWLLGKLLKLLGFVHSAGFSVGLVDTSNVFIEKELHGVLVLDFSGASEDADAETCLAEVAVAAKMLWQAVGGGDENPPHDGELLSAEHYDEYVAFLRRISDGKTDGANAEHTAIYPMADRIWPKREVAPGIWKRDFHNFTTYAL